ncbi:hypothetical protein BDZ89DRAFT_1082129 [Hymenopellis radicata]|nr:hypothetical protein BDZ89DRAFT_1082129 [Hymenopellis radicata]
MAFANTNLPHYTYTLNQCDEIYLASIRPILRGERPLHPDDPVWIGDVASALTREITLAEEHITRLQAHCDAARQHLALYHSAVAPIRRLPRDILVSIFELTFHEDYLPTDVGKPPWTLGQVCRSWRDIVVSASSLWAIVKYNARHDTRDTVTEIMQEYLRRSEQHPLTVVLEGEYHAPVYNLILKESHRWKLLYVGSIDSSFASCLSSIPGSMLQLEQLYIIEAEDDCNVFLPAPRLKRFWVPDYAGLCSLPSIAHVTHYAAQLKISDNILSESLSPSLITCYISLCDSSPPDAQSAPTFIHNSHLKVLEVWDGFALLNKLMLPALTTLCIDGYEDVPPTAASIIQAFIQRSSCSLTTLILRHNAHNDIAYACLHLPGLESLIHLDFTFPVDELEVYCQRNCSAFGSARIFPRLSTLTVTFEDDGHRQNPAKRDVPSWPAFMKALEERHAAGRLETFRIVQMRKVPSWIIEDLVALSQRSGLCVEYITPPVQRGLFCGREFWTSDFWDSL